MATDLKSRIIETSSRLFYQYGYNATSLRQIAEECGIQIGNLYYYYKKKSDLISFFNTDLFASYVRRLQKCYGEKLNSFAGVVAAEYNFLYYFASDKNNCRIFVEASAEQSLRDDYIQVHHDVMMELIPPANLPVRSRKAYMISNYVCGGDIQMMNYYYNHFSAVDFEETFVPCLKHRLVLLGLSKEEVQKYMDEGLTLARNILNEGKVHISQWQ